MVFRKNAQKSNHTQGRARTPDHTTTTRRQAISTNMLPRRSARVGASTFDDSPGSTSTPQVDAMEMGEQGQQDSSEQRVTVAATEVLEQEGGNRESATCSRRLLNQVVSFVLQGLVAGFGCFCAYNWVDSFRKVRACVRSSLALAPSVPAIITKMLLKSVIVVFMKRGGCAAEAFQPSAVGKRIRAASCVCVAHGAGAMMAGGCWRWRPQTACMCSQPLCSESLCPGRCLSDAPFTFLSRHTYIVCVRHSVLAQRKMKLNVLAQRELRHYVVERTPTICPPHLTLTCSPLVLLYHALPPQTQKIKHSRALSVDSYSVDTYDESTR